MEGYRSAHLYGLGPSYLKESIDHVVQGVDSLTLQNLYHNSTILFFNFYYIIFFFFLGQNESFPDLINRWIPNSLCEQSTYWDLLIKIIFSPIHNNLFQKWQFFWRIEEQGSQHQTLAQSWQWSSHLLQLHRGPSQRPESALRCWAWSCSWFWLWSAL